MVRSLTLLTALLFAFSFDQACAQVRASPDKRPNIVLIMADDLGYSDIGCYGGEIATPNLDLLAKKGLRFSRFYNASRCCPTRAALLTGLYNHQAGVGNMTRDQQVPGYRGFLTENTVTIAETLKDAGYHTGMVGKWHLSSTVEKKPVDEHLRWQAHQVSYPEFSPLGQYPVNRGFEKFYGNIWGVVNYFDPFGLVNGTEPVPAIPQDFYYTDAISDSASAYLRQFSKDDNPFFLYVAYTAPHWPLHAPPEEIEKYKETYRAGWNAIRQKRYDKMIAGGLFDNTKNILSPRWDGEKKWNDNPNKEWDIHAMAVRAAMIDRMDQGIGRIIKALEQTREWDNTLILFLSDNGASSDDAQEYGPGFDRPGETRKGEKIIYPIDKKVLPGPETTFASTDNMWSNVANTPFRYWKTEPYEGGICTPLIAHWPAGITARRGSVTDQAGHVIDFMATFLELARAKYPVEFRGRSISPTPGRSLVPILKGNKRQEHDYLFFEHLGRKAAIHGDWKLLAPNNKPWELYDLRDDRTEVENVATKYPEIVKALSGRWQEWAVQNNVFPKPAAVKNNK